MPSITKSPDHFKNAEPSLRIQPSPSSSRSRDTMKMFEGASGSKSHWGGSAGNESGDEEDDIMVDEDHKDDKGEVQKKPIKRRGPRACLKCRAIKMRCIPVDPSPTGSRCIRCQKVGQDCEFTKSLRGRKKSGHKADMAKSFERMEATLGIVLQSMGACPFDPLLDVAKENHPDGQVSGDHSVVDKVPFPGYLVNGLGVPGTTHQADQDSSPSLCSLPSDSFSPIGLLVEASRQRSIKNLVTLAEIMESTNGDLDVPDKEPRAPFLPKRGLANIKYFLPGPMNITPLRSLIMEHRMPPVLLAERIVTKDEVKELFDIYYSQCHLGMPILDPVLHTASVTSQRSPFLFTTICTIAARYYTKRRDLYRKCLRLATKSAFDVMARGFKSPEICQALLLLMHWNQASERYEEDRGYQLSGLAVRMATDLNLHQTRAFSKTKSASSPDQKSLHRRELLNRERTWMFCYIIDRAVSFQMGKPHSIVREDGILRGSKKWFTHTESQSTDVMVSMMVELQRITSRMVDCLDLDTQSGSAADPKLDYPGLIQVFLRQLDGWRRDWDVLCTANLDDQYKSLIATSLRHFYYEYHQLFVLSFAVQYAITSRDPSLDLAAYCAAAFNSAASLIAVVRDVLAPQGFFRNSPNPNFVLVGYACCSLLRFMDPIFKSFVNLDTAIQLVTEGAQVLEDIAVDETHTPALYASFLRELLAARKNDTPPTESSSKSPSTPPAVFVLPDQTKMDLTSFEAPTSDELMADLVNGTGGGNWDSALLGLMGGHDVVSEPWSIFGPSISLSQAPSPIQFNGF